MCSAVVLVATVAATALVVVAEIAVQDEGCDDNHSGKEKDALRVHSRRNLSFRSIRSVLSILSFRIIRRVG